MKSTKIPPSVNAILKDLRWTHAQFRDIVGTPPAFADIFAMPELERLARIAPYFKMYRSNPDWNL